MKLEKIFFLVTSVFPFVFSFQVAMSSIDNDDILSIGSQESCSLIEDARETLKKKRERNKRRRANKLKTLWEENARLQNEILEKENQLKLNRTYERQYQRNVIRRHNSDDGRQNNTGNRRSHRQYNNNRHNNRRPYNNGNRRDNDRRHHNSNNVRQQVPIPATNILIGSLFVNNLNLTSSH